MLEEVQPKELWEATSVKLKKVTGIGKKFPCEKEPQVTKRSGYSGAYLVGMPLQCFVEVQTGALVGSDSQEEYQIRGITAT